MFVFNINLFHFSHLFSALMCHTLIFPSLNPANNFFPKQFHVNEVQLGILAAFTLVSFPSLTSFTLVVSSAVKKAIGLVSVLIKS